ncbi:hypothetical protein [Acetobacterium carbinolicum]
MIEVENTQLEQVLLFNEIEDSIKIGYEYCREYNTAHISKP